uniref:Uncharacterized protein n=1 Tax=Anguilla anguilla TaxID=7936 RepID=A0A0E9TGD9_ANGAN
MATSAQAVEMRMPLWHGLDGGEDGPERVRPGLSHGFLCF